MAKQPTKTEVKVTALVPVKVEKEIQTKSNEIVKRAKAIAIKSQDDYDKAGEVLKDVNAYLKKIEESRVAIVKPINDSVTAINNMFKVFKADLSASDTTLRGVMKDWVIKERERVAKETAEAEKKIEKKIEKIEAKVDTDNPIAVAVAEQKKEALKLNLGGMVLGAKTQTENSTTVVTYSWEVIDFAKLPNEYKEIDTVALNKAKKNKGDDDVPLPIPGVKWNKEEDVRLK